MDRHINYKQTVPDAFRAVLSLERSVRSSGLEGSLIELVRLRASYLNGCAHCIDMHTKDARANGETEQRIYAVNVWRETPFFTDRERAALALTEAVTTMRHDAIDAAWVDVQEQFTDTEIVQLTMAVVAINCWNRLSVTFQAEVGSYQPRQYAVDLKEDA